MEGGVYLCSWRRVGGGYRVWWLKRPKVAAEGATFEEADAALSYEIGMATGDGENMHEYDPPAPTVAERAPHRPDLVMVGGNEYAWSKQDGELFEGGLCPECSQAIGARTATSITIAEMQGGARNGGSIRLPKRTHAGPSMRFVSEEFRALLTPEEDTLFHWRATEGPPRSKRQFFELVGAAVTVPYVAPLGAPIIGWTCETCGHETVPLASGRSWKGPSWSIAGAALPDGPIAMFAAGAAPDWDLCMSRERWTSMMKEKGAKGCSSSPLGVLGEDEIDRAPVRPTIRAQRERAERMEQERLAREARGDTSIEWLADFR